MWMSSNRLKLNSEKTQFIWLGGQQQLNKVSIDSINLLGSTVNVQSSVINLAVAIDGPLTLYNEISLCCESALRHSTNFVSCVSSEGRSQLRLVRFSSMHLSQVGWSTVTACLQDYLTNVVTTLVPDGRLFHCPLP